jgi:hypothetical protein
MKENEGFWGVWRHAASCRKGQRAAAFDRQRVFILRLTKDGQATYIDHAISTILFLHTRKIISQKKLIWSYLEPQIVSVETRS